MPPAIATVKREPAYRTPYLVANPEGACTPEAVALAAPRREAPLSPYLERALHEAACYAPGEQARQLVAEARDAAERGAWGAAAYSLCDLLVVTRAAMDAPTGRHRPQAMSACLDAAATAWREVERLHVMDEAAVQAAPVAGVAAPVPLRAVAVAVAS